MSLWSRMIGRRPPASTEPAVRASRPAAALRLYLDASLRSDLGCVRTNNEDAARILRSSDSEDASMLLVVADGMGGYNSGEVASAIAVQTLEARFDDILSNPGRELARAVELSNTHIHREARDHADRAGMGTTCTALLLHRGQAWSAHVGDSRIYLFRQGAMYQMTEDHSQVMEMVKAGLLDLSEARNHTDRNVITRALGRQPAVDVAGWPRPLPVVPGDTYLLCSDGLYDGIEDDELLAIVPSRSTSAAADELIQLARERGGSDNITVAIVRVMAGPEQDPQTESTSTKATRQVEVLQ